MGSKACFVCILALFIQNALSFSPGCSYASSGGNLAVKSYSPAVPSGIRICSENSYEGVLCVQGTLPLLGLTSVEGCIDSCGLGEICYTCDGDIEIYENNCGGCCGNVGGCCCGNIGGCGCGNFGGCGCGIFDSSTNFGVCCCGNFGGLDNLDSCCGCGCGNSCGWDSDYGYGTIGGTDSFGGCCCGNWDNSASCFCGSHGNIGDCCCGNFGLDSFGGDCGCGHVKCCSCDTGCQCGNLGIGFDGNWGDFGGNWGGFGGNSDFGGCCFHDLSIQLDNGLSFNINLLSDSCQCDNCQSQSSCCQPNCCQSNYQSQSDCQCQSNYQPQSDCCQCQSNCCQCGLSDKGLGLLRRVGGWNSNNFICSPFSKRLHTLLHGDDCGYSNYCGGCGGCGFGWFN